MKSKAFFILAKKLNNSDRKEFLIGNLAPDLSKLINQSRYVSHFLKKIKTYVQKNTETRPFFACI